MGYSPWHCEESDTTEHTYTYIHTYRNRTVKILFRISITMYINLCTTYIPKGLAN